MARLGEIATVVGGGTPKTETESYWGGDIAWATPAEINRLSDKFISRTDRTITPAGLASSGARLLPPGSVLLSSRAPIGLVAINRVPMATNQGFKSLIPDPTRVDSGYLYWWLKSHTVNLQHLGRGATFKEISKAIVEQIDLPLPPLPEQRRIAAILDEVDALRARRHRSVESLEELAGSEFLDRFDVPTDRSSLAELPRLGDFAELITDGEHQTPRRATTGHVLLSARNIRNGYVDTTNVDYVNDSEFNRIAKRCATRPGDVLISCSGSIGRVATVETDRPYVMVRSVALVRPGRQLRSKYLEYLLRSAPLQAAMHRVARSSAQANLFQRPIRELPVFVPSLEAQSRFEKVVEAIEERRQLALASVRGVDALYSSIQHRAFRGEL